MGWREQLQPASFRGVPFFIEGDDASIGRRTQVHEYPQRDEPYAEDMGRATREYNLQAFVVGSDYMAQRDRLLQALEQAGPGQLVHPYYGQIVVSIQGKARISHSRQNGGMCEIAINFVEAGDLSFPQAKDRTQSLAGIAADKLSIAALSDFTSKFSVSGFADFVSDGALANISTVISTVEGAMRYAKNPGALVGLVIGQTDLASVGTVGGKLHSLFAGALALYEGAAGSADTVKAGYYGGHANAVLDLYSALPADNVSVGRTPARVQLIENENAVNAIVRRQCLVQAAGATALMPALVQDDVIDIRTRLGKSIDDELLTAPDELVGPLIDLRSAVHMDLTERSRDSARLEIITPPLPVPAAVMAYDLYEDASRGDEIVARNGIPHPAFISDPVTVLSR